VSVEGLEVVPGWGFGGRELAWRVAAAVVITAAVYRYSLSSLAHELPLATPLAYLGLVPVLGACLFAMHGQPRSGDEMAVYDRQLDWIIGLPFVLAATAMLAWLPAAMPTAYWVRRIDLLSLPIFCAGEISILFGIRVLWRVRWAVAFLCLGWPALWTGLLGRILGVTASLTVVGVQFLVHALPLAKVVPGTDGSVFELRGPGGAFQVAIASPCSGANAMIGFALVGVAFVAVLQGSWRAKSAWLAFGLACIWMANLARIVVLLAVGWTLGERAAVDVLHPVLGFFTLGITVVAAGLVAPRFGLSLPPVRRRPDPGDAPARPPIRAVPALAVLFVVAVPLAWQNGGFARYSLIADPIGGARIAPVGVAPPVLQGIAPSLVGHYDWVRPYFGSSSRWLRWQYQTPGSGPPIYLDSIVASSLDRFQIYDLRSCYRFHRYGIRSDATVSIHGLNAERLVWNDGRTTWTALSWLWPVVDGGHGRYERVTLLSRGDGDQQVLGHEAELLVRAATAAPAPANGS